MAAPLHALPSLLAEDPAVLAAAAAADVVAVPDVARPLFIAALGRVAGRRPILVAVPTVAEAERISGDLAPVLGPEAVELFPAWETLPFERVSPNLETMGRRLRVMWRLRSGDESLAVVVAPVRALVQRLGPHVEDVEPIVLAAGERVDREELVERLIAMGYRREYQVESRGEVAVRGSIVDVYPSTADHPVRIDLWGDEVERLSGFSVSDQRSTRDLDAVTILPARELLPTDEVRERARALIDEAPWGREQWERIAEGQTFDGMESWLPWLCGEEHLLPDLLPDRAQVLLVEPRRLRDRAGELLDEEDALAGVLAGTWGTEPDALERLTLEFDRLLTRGPALVTSVLSAPDRPETPLLVASAFDPVVGDVEALADRVRALQTRGARVVVAAEGAASARRLSEVLADGRIDAPLLEEPSLVAGTVSVVIAPIERGVIATAAGVALVAEADLSGRRRVHRKARGARKQADFYDDLKVGDYVVHQVHGVGRFEGMVQRAIGGVERDYLMLAYKGSDRLYVPTDQIGTVRRYTGGDAPTLSRMGGAEWHKTRTKVRTAVAEIAAELVALYRERLATVGHAFGPDTPWQREMEDAFPYEETPDQMQAIIDVKADMERSIPMDRLVCGDVGYGKTEIALRAAFKAVQDGKQVAVLVPTTLLANQHGQTFRERYSGFPLRVEVLSRFLTAKEQDAVVAGLASGEVDVVVGTHRLLSEDLAFKDLGLLVIDEEQRFGVEHKERIKRLRAAVDVLTLSATPIPRTLEMSLTGIRDLSLVQTPPEERQPILTYVGEYDERAVSEAIRRELLREGQVFYVHNRVQDIEHIAEQVRDLVPEARVQIAHGQMDEGTLERAVLSFADREADVLVCTTIVESGLDLPMANTLVVDRADLLGLSQLYQLRGRVGRRGSRAYAYLLHPQDRVLSEEAYERLKAIGEFTDLGSGFKLAMRDLEIRGAGNMLGGAQSGHIAAVGFDLYCELVTEAVAELKGERIEPPFEVVLDLPTDAHLPRTYIERDDVRMEAYRRLAAVESPTDVDDVESEWLDRYGPPPAAADALLDAARLRAECVRLRIPTVSIVPAPMQRASARVGITLPESRKVRLMRLAPKAVTKDDAIVVPLDVAPARAVAALTALLRELVPPEDSGS